MGWLGLFLIVVGLFWAGSLIRGFQRGSPQPGAIIIGIALTVGFSGVGLLLVIG